MSKKTYIILPKLGRIMTELGENIRLARLRRRFSAELLSNRAGISRNPLRDIEKGSPNVGFGAYATVLFSLGLENDLLELGKDDELGRKLQDANIPLKKRAPKVDQEKGDDDNER